MSDAMSGVMGEYEALIAALTAERDEAVALLRETLNSNETWGAEHERADAFLARLDKEALDE